MEVILPLCSSLVNPHLDCPVLDSPVQERYGHGGPSPAQMIKMIKWLEHLTYKGRLRELELSREGSRGILSLCLNTSWGRMKTFLNSVHWQKKRQLTQTETCEITSEHNKTPFNAILKHWFQTWNIRIPFGGFTLKFGSDLSVSQHTFTFSWITEISRWLANVEGFNFNAFLFLKVE